MFLQDALLIPPTTAVDLNLNCMCALGVLRSSLPFTLQTKTLAVTCAVHECLFPVSLLLTDTVLTQLRCISPTN